MGAVPLTTLKIERGVSSAGRAPALQAGGHRFDPGTLHSVANPLCLAEHDDFATFVLRSEPLRPSPASRHRRQARGILTPKYAASLARFPANDGTQPGHVGA